MNDYSDLVNRLENINATPAFRHLAKEAAAAIEDLRRECHVELAEIVRLRRMIEEKEG